MILMKYRIGDSSFSFSVSIILKHTRINENCEVNISQSEKKVKKLLKST